jgi:predicted nucleic acid-binding protein
MADYLLDTNVIIDCLRGDPHKKEGLAGLVAGGSLLHSCEITVAETFSGMREEERQVTEKFLNSLRYLPMEEEVARQGGELRRTYRAKGKNLTIADTLIASLAMNRNLILLTDNLKDYPMPQLRKEKL